MKSPMRSPQAPSQQSRGRAFDRHSATGTRGLPKKNGAGGKGVWGAMLDQDASPGYLDKNDPNYDSGEDEPVQELPEISLNMPLPQASADKKVAANESAPSSAE